MPTEAVLYPEKSTNVRSFNRQGSWTRRAQVLRSEVQRGALRALAAVFPKLAHAHAANRFGTPERPPARELERDDLPARRSWLAFGEQQLAVYEWGSVFGPSVLLAHGWSGAASQLREFVAPLVARGFRVVAFDQPGHGHSSGRYATLLDFAAATETVARTCGPIHGVIAHSLGATATALALSRGLNAERVVLIAPPGRVQYFALGFGRRLGLDDADALGMLAELERRLGGDLNALELTRLAPGMRAQLLLFHDAGDREVPFEHGAALAAAWPAARFEALSGLGHRRPLRDPQVIEQAVEFVEAGARAVEAGAPASVRACA